MEIANVPFGKMDTVWRVAVRILPSVLAGLMTLTPMLSSPARPQGHAMRDRLSGTVTHPEEKPAERGGPRDTVARVRIEYQHNSLRICVAATAFIDGRLVGQATMVRLEKGKYIEVKEIHYSLEGPRRMVYEAISRFSIPLGAKISEESVSGAKLLELFRTWPV